MGSRHLVAVAVAFGLSALPGCASIPKDALVLTPDTMERRQLRKAETYRPHFLDRIAFELLIR